MAGSRRDLYLQVSGDVRGLQTAMSAGKTIVNEFGGTAINVIEEVEKEMAKLGTTGMPGLKQVEKAYVDTFKRISDSARDVANAPSGAAAAQILDANATREAAAAATAKAASLRTLAEAANRADQATGGASAGTRAYAAAAATAAINAEKEADALREQAQVLGLVERQLGVSGSAARRNVAISGEARAGYQQLSYQLGDVATQYASGTAMSLIFAQQSTQVVQAIGLVSGKTTGLLGLLGGPWGIAFTSALVLLTPWVAKLLEGNDALGDAVDKLKKDAQQSDITRRAHEAFTGTLEGQIDAQRRLNEEMERGFRSQRQQNRDKLQTSLDNEAKALIAVEKAERALTAARALGGTRARRQEAPERIREAESALAEAQAQRDRAQQGARDARITIALQEAQVAADPIATINQNYNDMVDKATAAAKANDKLTASLRATIDTINGKRKVELEAEQARQSAASRKPPALGTQIADERSASLLSSAQQYRGMSETGNNDALQSLFKQAGMTNVDPKITAWCAAFVNAVLATNGLPSTGNLSARSFASYGTETKSPVKGDIVVSKRGTGAQGHVGFFQGVDAKGNVQVFGGNTSDKVGTQTVKRSDVLAFRRAPTVGASVKSAEAQQGEQVRNQDVYASLIAKATDEQLRLQQSRVLTISEAADLDVQAVSLARADIDRAAQKGVELGRWTQAEADAVKMITSGNELAAVIAIRGRERVQLAQRKLELENEALGDQLDKLRLDADLATTAADRRAIARQILKIEQDQVRIALQSRLAGEKDPDKQVRLQGQIDALPSQYEKRSKLLNRQNADPLQSYGQKLIDATGDMDEAFKGVKADGLESLEDGLVGVISGTESVADAFHNMAEQIIADLARIAVRKLIVQTIGSSFFGLKDGGSVDGFADGGIPGFAAGGAQRTRGRISGPGTARSDSILAMLGGREPIRLSDGEFVVNAESTARYLPLIEAINENRIPGFATGGMMTSRMPRIPSISAAEQAMGGRSERMALDVNVKTEASPYLISTVEQTSLRTVAGAAEPIMAGAEQRTLRRLRRRSLPGGYAG